MYISVTLGHNILSHDPVVMKCKIALFLKEHNSSRVFDITVKNMTCIL